MTNFMVLSVKVIKIIENKGSTEICGLYELENNHIHIKCLAFDSQIRKKACGFSKDDRVLITGCLGKPEVKEFKDSHIALPIVYICDIIANE